MTKNGNKNIPQVRPSIDLHGYRKSEGISALTVFLDQANRSKGEVWVLVITGSGANSHAGPVLRSAVQALFEKRQMVYTVNHGKGSFNVKANSGFVLYEPLEPSDTKLLLKEAPDPFPFLPKMSDLVARASTSTVNPVPAEVAANDANLKESRKERKKEFKERKKEERIIKKALSMSLLESKKEEEEEEKKMVRAFSLSMIEIRAEDRDLQKALELSQTEFESMRNDDDDSLSMIETRAEEGELQKALELSQTEFESMRTDDDDLQRAIELSQKVTCLDDEEVLRILNESQLNMS
jgi:hypothetical protein